jgi:hypothetical protein
MYRQLQDENLNFENFDLPAYREISKNAIEANLQPFTDNAAGKIWFDNNAERLKDYLGNPLVLEFDNFKSANIKWECLKYIDEVLNNPDEVFITKIGKNEYKSRQLKYFKTNPIVVEIQYHLKNKTTIINRLEALSKADNLRVGVLVKSKKI